MKFAVWIFKFFASLKLAIFLFLALAFVFAVGTFVESTYGQEAASLLVYRSGWTSLFLILLALNVLAAALDRLPWKRKHTGFVITHAGIILMLAGSLVTRAFGVEGQMAIAESETTNRMVLNEAMLQVSSLDSGLLNSFPIPPRAFPWQGRERLHPLKEETRAVPRVSLLRYYPKSSREERIEPSSNGPAAVRVVLESSWMQTSHWLVLDDPRRSRVLLGPAQLRFSREPIPREEQPEAMGFLEFKFEDFTVELTLEEGRADQVPLEGAPYKVTVIRILRDAIVEGRELVDQSEEWNNPACEFILEGKDFKERHTVFSKFPDFPTRHGMKPSQAGVRIYYRRPEDTQPKNELRLIWQEEGLPLYQVRKGEEISEGTVRLEEDYETGWMDFKFRMEDYYPHTRTVSVFSEEPVGSQAEEHLSAVEIELEEQGERQSLWLGQGDRQTVTLGKGTFQILYGFRMLPIGFRLLLRDFRVEHYPGTRQPASFESDVTLKDDFTGKVRDLTIGMNEPLKYRGFKIFQSGYQQPPGEPEVSIFSVAKDAGIGLKYFGAVVLIGGILTMFYTRRFSNRPQIGESSVLVGEGKK